MVPYAKQRSRLSHARLYSTRSSSQLYRWAIVMTTTKWLRDKTALYKLHRENHDGRIVLYSVKPLCRLTDLQKSWQKTLPCLYFVPPFFQKLYSRVKVTWYIGCALQKKSGTWYIGCALQLIIWLTYNWSRWAFIFNLDWTDKKNGNRASLASVDEHNLHSIAQFIIGKNNDGKYICSFNLVGKFYKTYYKLENIT